MTHREQPARRGAARRQSGGAPTLCPVVGVANTSPPPPRLPAATASSHGGKGALAQLLGDSKVLLQLQLGLRAQPAAGRPPRQQLLQHAGLAPKAAAAPVGAGQRRQGGGGSRWGDSRRRPLAPAPCKAARQGQSRASVKCCCGGPRRWAGVVRARERTDHLGWPRGGANGETGPGRTACTC